MQSIASQSHFYAYALFIQRLVEETEVFKCKHEVYTFHNGWGLKIWTIKMHSYIQLTGMYFLLIQFIFQLQIFYHYPFLISNTNSLGKKGRASHPKSLYFSEYKSWGKEFVHSRFTVLGCCCCNKSLIKYGFMSCRKTLYIPETGVDSQLFHRW